MVEAVSSAALDRFTAADDAFASLDSETAAALVISSSDVALVVDNTGVVRDVAFGNAELAKEAYQNWIGRKWVDTVTSESRPKIEELLRDTKVKTASRWRQVNYPAPQGRDIPVRHSAIRFAADGRLVVVGRDLRAMAALQLRVAEAQQTMEREYALIRNAEKRYRLLFQLANEAVLIVDEQSLRITEANPAALALVGKGAKKLIGQGFVDLFDVGSKPAAQSFVAALRLSPRVDNAEMTLASAKTPVSVAGSLFRQDSAAHLLVLLSSPSGAAPRVDEAALLLKVQATVPDAFVVTDFEHRILSANAAFVDLVQVGNLEHARGELLERWVGRPGVDVELLFSNLRTHGVVRHFATILRSEFGSTEEVEIAAVSAPGAEPPCLGFTIRSVGWRAHRDRLGGRELPRTVEQFADLVGRVPLRTLVRETTDLIERLCIEAALDLTRDNRASAAEMLGLSRQGLYAKLRRYGLGDLDESDDAPN